MSNVDLPGSDIPEFYGGSYTPSWFACGVACSRIGGDCQSFSWDSTSQLCYVKNEIPQQSEKKGYFSGIAGCFNATTSASQRMEEDIFSK